MSEATRFLRYGIPGGVFVFAIVLWLGIDPEPPAEPLNAPLAALLIAASFPAGFLVANLALASRWSRVAWMLWGWRLKWPNDEGVANLRDKKPTQRERLQAVVTSTHQFDQMALNEPVRGRLNAWLDLMNALAHAAVALRLAAYFVIVLVLATWASPIGDRLIVAFSYVLVVVAISFLMAAGQERVVFLVDRYRQAILDTRQRS